MSPVQSPEIRVGVSACLLGDEVRYNGGHARDRYVVDTLAEHFTFVKVCPEEEVGMGTPRPTVRLEGHRDDPRMIEPVSGKDWTPAMTKYSAGRARELGGAGLSGFIFKSKSPSCGVFRVKVYDEKGNLGDPGAGLFARAMMKRHPLLPMEEEGRLRDARLRENFLERVFAYHRLKSLFAGRWKRGELIEFHAREKYLLMAHSPAGLKRLGQLAARVKDHSPAEFRDLYMRGFMEALEKKATVKSHVNALQHMAGYLRDHLTPEARRSIRESIEDYRRALVPLIVPMTLLKHYIELHEVAYVGEQTYLNPHPRELKLRNHV
jgi:uncharacterized protein YbgA (DUF1722 family)/uncharacterized protein YbbK (DUF523 family)